MLVGLPALLALFVVLLWALVLVVVLPLLVAWGGRSKRETGRQDWTGE